MTTRTQELRTSAPPPRRRRPWLIAIVLVLVLIAGLLVTAVVARRGSDALAELRVRDTNVQVAEKGAGLAKGSEGQSLAVGDVVQTDNKGQAQVDYFDGSLTRLDVNTRFEIRELSNAPSGRRISLDVKAGRTWNRVVRLSSTSDRYEVHMANAVAVVRGTTFLVDCRVQPCAIGAIEDTTHVRSEDGTEMDATDGDCIVLTEEGGLEECDDETRKRVMGGSWVKMNLAEDELIGLPPVETESPSPSPTPEDEPNFVPRRAPDPTPTPRRTLPPLPTEDPNETPRPSETPFGQTEPPPPPPTEPPPPPPSGSPLT